MPPIPDPYRVLGVAREATVGEIRTAHRRLAKQYHPDATGGDTERFLAVQEAYQVLSDPLRRREWDARHRPGPVRADTSPRTRPTTTRGGAARGATTGRGQAQASPAGDANAAASGPRPARNPRTQSNRQRRRPDPFSPSGREPTSDSYTWSAQDVPWWSSGPDRSRSEQGVDGTAGTTGPANAGDPAADATAPPAQGTTSSAAGTTHRAAPSGADFDV
ncbi:MAG: J domain-containing protein, partial [Solirubrobacteraceae bacterium]